MIYLIALLLILTPSAFAEEIGVTPVSGDVSIESSIASAESHAKADLNGAGSSVSFTYTSDTPTDVFILFLKSNGGFDSQESLKVTLPKGDRNTATIDLRSSPAWHPKERTYRFHFLSSSARGAEFHDVEFTKASIGEVASAVVGSALTPEPYTPSSYHRLQGYSILGYPLTTIVGVLLILVVIILIKKNPKLILPILISVTLLSHLRFSGDALIYSVKHVSTWMNKGTYEVMGSLPTIGSDIINNKATSVYLCNDGTSYASRILRYYMAPIKIVVDDPSHVLVHRSLNASLEGNTLRC
ncbi:MAG: hypothetical protein QF442_03955, partial [Candidatus Peribacteraceae bacterium]|nr:hypothetical protein [Candidatus Peribacteraceae bacterium]